VPAPLRRGAPGDRREGRRRLAFADLYRRYVRMVHGVMLARLPRAEVDDLCRTSSSLP
jgi:hypothetical protein